MTKKIHSLLLIFFALAAPLFGALPTPTTSIPLVLPVPQIASPVLPTEPLMPIEPAVPPTPSRGLGEAGAPSQPSATPTPTPPVPPLPPTQSVIVPPDQPIQIGAFAPPTDDKSKEDADIYLNFESATLASVVNYLGEQKKINVIPHKDLETTKVSLTTRNPLTLDRAWDVLLTLLEMNGFSLIKVGNIYRVVPNKDNGAEPLPTYSSESGMELDKLPDSDLVIRYVYFFKNIKAETAKNILLPMITDADKNIIINPDLNACIIKDQCLNIKAAMKIVKELDDGGLRESIEVIQLKWVAVDTVTKIFDEILGSSDRQDRVIRFSPLQQKESAFFSQNTKIIGEPVNNALILLGTQKSIDKIKEFVYKNIDVPIDDAESRLHVRELRYVRAQDIKPILDDVIKPPRGAGTEKSVVLEGGYKIFEDVIISAEQDDDGGEGSKRGGGNRIIVACNRDDWKRIEDFIDKIDKPQPQVAIEVMIVDVTIEQEKQLGAQLWNLKSKSFGKNINAEFTNLLPLGAKAVGGPTAGGSPNSYVNIAKADVEGTGSPTFFTLGQAATTEPNAKGDNIWGVIKAILSTNNSQIILQPYIIANNNQKCKIALTDSRRVDGEMEKGSGVTVAPIINKVPVDAATSVEITPYINLTNNVDLSIDSLISEFQTTDDPNLLIKTTRAITTKISMAAGEVLVLGGLTKSKLSESMHKTPILGDIPILGNLFKNKRKHKTETNLYLFIRPSIIKPRFEGAPDEYSQLKLDYAKFQLMKNDLYVHDRDPIQRWFFKPSKQTIRHKLSDAARGILRPIDNFAYGRLRPKSVNIQEDPYFQASEAVGKVKEKREAEKRKQAARALPPEHPLIKNAHLRAQETT